MVKQSAIVDCVSVDCPNVLAETIQKLAKIARGEIVEVICNTRYEASQVKAGAERAGHKIVGLSEDPMGLTRILVQKTK